MAKAMRNEGGPLAPLRGAITEVPHLVDRLDELITERWAPVWSALRGPEELALRLPPVDVFEEGTEVVAKAELPGMKKEEIGIEVAPETITLSGKKAKEERVERRSYYRFERASGSFTRTVRLPAEVEVATARASYKDGVLEIRAAKSTTVRPTSKKLEIE